MTTPNFLKNFDPTLFNSQKQFSDAVSSSLGKTTVTAANDTEVFSLFSLNSKDVNGRPIGLFYLTSTAISSAIDTTGALNDYVEELGIGSFILASTNTGGVVSSGMFIVRTNDGTDVDVANISSFGLANTD